MMANLTREEITQLEGRELDRAVAEARGWERVEFNESYGDLAGFKPGYSYYRGLTRYHSEISPAWELMDEMRAEFQVDLLVGRDECCCKIHHYDPYPMPDIHAATVPTAIARAYLIWKTEGEDDKSNA